MTGYWFRHRFIWSLLLSIVISLITVFLFVSSFITAKADNYNSQSIYRNSNMDFIAPEPSFEQVEELPGTHGIDKIFPYYITKTDVLVNGRTRSTEVLLSDQFQNIDITMYNSARLIEKADLEYNNPIYVDWKFCNDTKAGIGDTVSFTLAGEEVEYQISAIYETNAIYDGGAIIAQISDEQKKIIENQSGNNGYSGMYLSASDYNTCRTYLITEYRPLGRLRDRSDFDNDDQYQIHYDAIMSSSYANEITDFRVLENTSNTMTNSISIWIGAALSAVLIFAFNTLMFNRGEEKGYFTKDCIPKGVAVKPYYEISFYFEMLSTIILFIFALLLRLRVSTQYLPQGGWDIKYVVIPIVVVISELICRANNYSKITEITKKVEAEIRARKEAEARARAEADKSASVNAQANIPKD